MTTGVELTQIESEMASEEEQAKGEDFTQTEGSMDGRLEEEADEEGK